MTWLIRHARRLLWGYLVVLAVVLLAPTSDLGAAGVRAVASLLVRLGVATSSPTLFHRIEFAENVAIIVPATFLASLEWSRWTWRDWTAVGFVAALSVEALQGLFLSGRSATFSDVVANTSGAFVGAFAVWLLRRMRAEDRVRSTSFL